MSLFDFEEPQGEAEDNSSQLSRDRRARGDTANWSRRLRAQIGLLGKEPTWQGLELWLDEDKAHPSPRDKEENQVGTNVRGAQDNIAAESEEERESAGRRQGALQGPPAIEQRNIAGPAWWHRGERQPRLHKDERRGRQGRPASNKPWRN